MKIVNPVVVEPLLAEWAEAKAKIEADTDAAQRMEAIRAEGAALFASDPSQARATEPKRQKEITTQRGRATRALNAAQARQEDFIERLRKFRVLDPACGSGNFLYLSLRALKDIEHQVNLE